MTIEVTRKDLICLVRGSSPGYNKFDHPLLIKAGHSYSDAYGRTSWDRLDKLTDEELYQLYKICSNQ